MAWNRREFFRRLGLFTSGSFVWFNRKATAARESGKPAEPPAPEPLTTRINVDADVIRRDDFDVVVVGGGIAGTCAAISAARNGAKVALVHNRSMLGGNSSSEVRLFPENNLHNQVWIKEGGIHEEFITEERVRNHVAYREGMMNCHWDLVLYEWVLREKNLTLFLNTHMHRVFMKDPGHIRAIYAIQLGTEKEFELGGSIFIDATGDGVLAHRAGADYRWGREARSEYQEPLAPEQPDDKVMGNTLFFRATDAGRAVPFKLPDWAVSFPTEADLTGRWHGVRETGYWWIEVGAPYHPIRDNEEIRHEALRNLLGVWDHIKHHCAPGMENFGLDFVGFWPYKRECRRIIGDTVITQQQVQNPRLLDDNVAYGCWGIDIHTQGGILARNQIPYPPPRKDEYWDDYHALVYGIPLRALYSRNVENLMMAGRPISCSYVAFASTRVLSTGAIVGQAVGTAAALCKLHKVSPREIARKHARQCQQMILRQDGHIPGLVNEDDADLARQATVTASSESALIFPDPTGLLELKFPHACLFPVSADRIDRVELPLISKLGAPTRLVLGLRQAAHVWDFRSDNNIAAAEATVPAGHDGWVSFDFNLKVDPARLYYVHLPAQAGIFWKSFQTPEGRPEWCPVGTTSADRPGKKAWRPILQAGGLCLRVSPESWAYGPQNVNTGTNRPDCWTNIWISDPARKLPAWLELTWPRAQRFNTVQITFDTDCNQRVTLPLFRYPDCVKHYAIEIMTAGGWKKLARISDNYARQRVHRFERVDTDRLRLRILETNGGPTARVYEVRVYDEA